MRVRDSAWRVRRAVVARPSYEETMLSNVLGVLARVPRLQRVQRVKTR